MTATGAAAGHDDPRRGERCQGAHARARWGDGHLEARQAAHGARDEARELVVAEVRRERWHRGLEERARGGAVAERLDRLERGRAGREEEHADHLALLRRQCVHPERERLVLVAPVEVARRAGDRRRVERDGLVPEDWRRRVRRAVSGGGGGGRVAASRAAIRVTSGPFSSSSPRIARARAPVSPRRSSSRPRCRTDAPTLVIIREPHRARRRAGRGDERVAHARLHAVRADHEVVGLARRAALADVAAVWVHVAPLARRRRRRRDARAEVKRGALAREVDADARDAVRDADVRAVRGGELLEEAGLEPVALEHARHVLLLGARRARRLEPRLAERQRRAVAVAVAVAAAAGGRRRKAEPPVDARRPLVDALHAVERAERLLPAPVQPELVAALACAPRGVRGGGRRRERVEDVDAPNRDDVLSQKDLLLNNESNSRERVEDVDAPAAPREHDRRQRARRAAADDCGRPISRAGRRGLERFRGRRASGGAAAARRPPQRLRSQRAQVPGRGLAVSDEKRRNAARIHTVNTWVWQLGAGHLGAETMCEVPG